VNEGEKEEKEEEGGGKGRWKDALAPEEEDVLCRKEEKVYSNAIRGRRSRSGGLG
jgi:hypothetical protein